MKNVCCLMMMANVRITFYEISYYKRTITWLSIYIIYNFNIKMREQTHTHQIKSSVRHTFAHMT